MANSSRAIVRAEEFALVIDLPPHDDRTPRWVAPVALVAAWAFFFAPALFGGRVFYFRDLFFFHRPLREVVVRALARGEAPYLNPGLNLGQPMLADPSYSVFYPANLLYLVLPFATAWNVVLSGHVLWAAVGTFLLARALGARRAPALAGAFVFAFSGPVVSSLNCYSLLLATSWTPWVLLGGLAAWRQGGMAVPLTALALAAQALACEPTVFACTSGVLAAGWIAGLVQSEDRRVRLARGAAIAGLAALLASAQIVPTLAWLPQTDRGAALPFRESAAWWSLHPERLPEFLAPRVNGNAIEDRAASFWGGHLSDAGYPYVPRLYLGWLPLILAPLAWRAKWGKAALALGAAGLILALGHHLPGYVWIHRVVPVLWITRYPEKFTLFAALGLGLALALGASAASGARKLLVAAAAAVLLAAAASLALGSTGVPAQGITAAQEALRSTAILHALARGAIATALGLLLVSSRTRHVAALVLPCAVFLDVSLSTREVAKTCPAATDARLPRLLREAPDLSGAVVLPLVELQSDAFFRGRGVPYDTMQEALFPYSGLRWGVRYGAAEDIARTMSVLSARRRTATIEGMSRGSLAEAQASGIAAVVAVDGAAIAGLAYGPRVRVGDLEIGAAYLPGPASGLVRFESGDGRATAKELAPHRVEVAVDAASAGFVVVAREAIPGWSAILDGAPAALESDPLGLLRVRIGSGRHALTLAYAPPGLRAGLGLTLLGAFLAIAGIWRSRGVAGRIPDPRGGW